MFRGELAALQADHPGYRLRLRETRTQGRLDLSTLDADVPDWRERQTWACGPEGLLTGAERVWSAAVSPIVCISSGSRSPRPRPPVPVGRSRSRRVGAPSPPTPRRP